MSANRMDGRYEGTHTGPIADEQLHLGAAVRSHVDAAFAAGRAAGLREAAEIADEIIGYVCPEVVDAIRARADEGER